MGKNLNRITGAGLLVALGIIYGDIGTSPLYVFNAIIKDNVVTDDLILGALSCIIWTITLQTTVKYVILILRADNKGEGGIFSLYALVRRRKKWLVGPAMIGGASLLADGIITPDLHNLCGGRTAKHTGPACHPDRHHCLYCIGHHPGFFLPSTIWHRLHWKIIRTNDGHMVYHARCTRTGKPDG